MRYFLAAAKEGSLRAAAEACGISQPALGQQISLLEEELDLVLLTRSRAGVQLTPAGRLLQEAMSRLVAAEDAVIEMASDSRGSYRGRVRIGAIPTFVEFVVGSVVGALRDRHPDLNFMVSEAGTGEIEAGVASGELELGLVTVPLYPCPPDIRRTHLFDLPLGVLMRTQDLLANRPSLAWKDLETWPIVTMRKGTVLWERLHSDVKRPNIVVETQTAQSLRAMVANGAGLGVVTSLGPASEQAGLRWVPLSDAEPVEAVLIQRRNSLPSPSSLIARDLIIEKSHEFAAGF